MLLSHVLSPPECTRLISLAETLGYTPDAVPGIDCLQVLAGGTLLSPLFERVKPLLPPILSGTRLVGLNARWRCFRYTPGVCYRPHIDGAWPGSGLDHTSGAFVEDVHDGRVYSRLTFLIYLNAGFDGGGTTFFLPGEVEGHIDAWGVEPCAGACLVFPHGDATGSLVHEGSCVAPGGVKYVIRSDVLYERAAL